MHRRDPRRHQPFQPIFHSVEAAGYWTYLLVSAACVAGSSYLAR